MVSITEVAAQKLKEVIANSKNPQNTFLRLSFGGFG